MKRLLGLFLALALAFGPVAQAGQPTLLGAGGVTVASGSLPLDSGPAASRAVSLRLLRTAYAGNDITVRRSSDSATSNIGFSSGVINTTALLSFCAATTCVVTTWYDQSGNARDWTAISGAEPVIVSAGSLITKGGFAALQDSTAQMGFTSTGASTGRPLTILSVWSSTTPTLDAGVLVYGNGSVNGVYYGTSTGGTANGKQSIASVGCCRVVDSTTALTSDTLFQGGIRFDTSTTYTFYLNGVANGTGADSTSFNAYTAATLGAEMSTGSTNGMIGFLSEFVEWTSALTDPQALAFAGNQKTYYGL